MDLTLHHIPQGEILRYMGCGATAEPMTLALVEKCAARLLACAQPRWLFRTFDLVIGPGGVLLDCGLLLPGRALAEHLAGCNRAALFCATLSAPVDALLRRAQAEDMAEALTLEACATAAVETVCDLATLQIKEQFPDCSHSFRFSPGYGDLPLDLQGPLLTLLDAPRKIGLCATEGSVLTPRKSVTAILGLSHGVLSPQAGGCTTCNLRGHCKFQCKERAHGF